MFKVRPQPLTCERFAPFGDVIQIEGSEQFEINSGYTTRVHDLIDIQLGGVDAWPQFSLFLGRPRPLEITMLEKHPLGSQAFFPVEERRWLVVVAIEPKAESVRAFWASGRQGVNYHRNIWHHPLLVLEPQQFVVIDRGGDGHNCDETALDTTVFVTVND